MIEVLIRNESKNDTLPISLFEVSEPYKKGDSISVRYLRQTDGKIKNLEIADEKYGYKIPLVYIIVGVILVIGGTTINLNLND